MTFARASRALALSLLFIYLPFGSSFQIRGQQTQSARTREQGIALYKANDYKQAADVLRAVVNDAPQDSEAWHYLGLSLVNMSNAQEARRAFEQAIESGSPAARRRTKLAYIFFGLGNFDEAIRQALSAELDSALSQPPDFDASLILGVAYVRRQRRASTAALANSEVVLQSNPSSATAHLQKAQAKLALTTPEGEITSYLSRLPRPNAVAPIDEKAMEARRAALQSQFKEAATSFEAYLRFAPGGKESPLARTQLEALRIYTQSFNNPGASQPIYSASQVTTKASIRSKPEPGYTRSARKNDVSGVVSLRAVLASDGTVKFPLVLLSLPHGLTEKALDAMRKIRFEPATKDGRPVSQYVIVNYAFNIY